MELTEIIEALLFASQEPLSTKEMLRAVKTTIVDREGEPYDSFKKLNEAKVAETVAELIKAYEESGRAFTLVERPTGWRLYARPEYAEWIRALMPGKKGSRLSPPALETLAIIAYRQPLTKAHIESVRGVAVDGVLQTLLDRNLVRIGGRADLPGRPLLYESTELFLEYFGIKDLDDLPNSSELRRTALPDPEPEKEETPQEEQLSMADIEPPKEGEEKAQSDPVEAQDAEAETESPAEITESQAEPESESESKLDADADAKPEAARQEKEEKIPE